MDLLIYSFCFVPSVSSLHETITSNDDGDSDGEVIFFQRPRFSCTKTILLFFSRGGRENKKKQRKVPRFMKATLTQIARRTELERNHPTHTQSHKRVKESNSISRRIGLGIGRWMRTIIKLPPGQEAAAEEEEEERGVLPFRLIIVFIIFINISLLPRMSFLGPGKNPRPRWPTGSDHQR